MAAAGVIVTLAIPNYPENCVSCSGIILDQTEGFLLGSGALLGAFMNCGELGKILENLKMGINPVEYLNANGHLQVTAPPNSKIPRKTSKWKFCAIFKCEDLSSVLESLLPESNGWNLDNNNCELDDKKPEPQELMLARDLLSYFILIQANSDEEGDISVWLPNSKCASLVTKLRDIYRDCPKLNAGDVVQIVSTPFGNLSPSVFLNSVTQGIVANVAGRNQVLIMTDARCVPGCEGGALYAQGICGKFRNLAGIVILPFCWRQNEWVGLSFVCSIKQIIESLVKCARLNMNSTMRSNPTQKGSRWTNALKSVVMIKSGLRWGSGILLRNNMKSSILERNQRLILTCSHVIQGRQQGKVKVRPCGQFALDADIVYAIPKGEVFDLAVLRVNLPSKQYLENISCLELQSSISVEGDEVVCIGHALFDDSHKLHPLMTKGILSKTICHKNQVVMFQASCAVHPGASGGALVSTVSGEICGVVVCNTKDENSGASYPHVGICLPSTVILPALNEYLSSGSLDAFKAIHNTAGPIQELWTLQQRKLTTSHF